MRTSLTVAAMIGVVALGAGVLSAFSPDRDDEREVPNLNRRVAPELTNTQRPPATGVSGAMTSRADALASVAPAQFPTEFRTIDGRGNNPLDPEKGAAHVPFIRKVPAAYTDGAGDLPARMDGPNARDISNAMCAQLEDMPNPQGISDYLWQWGQFLDHDITETPLAAPSEPIDIDVPAGDAFFDPFNTGGQSMALDRSSYVIKDGVREQINILTAFIDASNVYGSEDDRAIALRTNDGTGRLKTSAGDLLPFNTMGLPNADDQFDQSLYVAGDVRVNEQTALCAIHTLFVREHNYWADTFRRQRPDLSGDEVYEWARAIVAAEMQAITYNEFLPLLLGENGLPEYTGYKVEVDPGIANVFATAAFRVGHTMLSARMMRLGADMQEAPEGHLPLRDAFFAPETIGDHGISTVLRGLAGQPSQIIDAFVVDDIRNFLFGPPGSGGFDLASLNIQRGRDHGVGSFNDVRESYGLARLTDISQVNPDPAVASALASVYDDVDDLDPWIAMLAEPHVEGALVGETLHAVLADQFTRLRDGDRFWYRSYLPKYFSRMVEKQTLGVIIRRNTEAGAEVPRDVFKVVPRIDADWNGDGVVDLADVQAFVADWHNGEGDVNGDGVSDFDDVLDFLQAWGAAYQG